jgi:hypothetical protein
VITSTTPATVITATKTPAIAHCELDTKIPHEHLRTWNKEERLLCNSAGN